MPDNHEMVSRECVWDEKRLLTLLLIERHTPTYYVFKYQLTIGNQACASSASSHMWDHKQYVWRFVHTMLNPRLTPLTEQESYVGIPTLEPRFEGPLQILRTVTEDIFGFPPKVADKEGVRQSQWERLRGEGTFRCGWCNEYSGGASEACLDSGTTLNCTECGRPTVLKLEPG